MLLPTKRAFLQEFGLRITNLADLLAPEGSIRRILSPKKALLLKILVHKMHFNKHFSDKEGTLACILVAKGALEHILTPKRSQTPFFTPNTTNLDMFWLPREKLTFCYPVKGAG